MLFRLAPNVERKGTMAGKRLNVCFTEEASERLEEMSKQIGTSKREVVCRAITLLALATREAKNGNTIGICKDGTQIKEIVGLF
jgi:hypothetical protein